MSSRSVIKFKVKFFTTTVKHLRGKVWTPWPAKFLYSKGVVAWMRGCSAAKREDIVNMDLRVVLWLPWQGNNMVRQFRLNSAKILNDFLWTKCLVKFFNQLKIRRVLCAWIYVFFCEAWCIIVIYRLLWSPYVVRSSRAPSEGYNVHAEGALELHIQKSWQEHRDTVVHSSFLQTLFFKVPWFLSASSVSLRKSSSNKLFLTALVTVLLQKEERSLTNYARDEGCLLHYYFYYFQLKILSSNIGYNFLTRQLWHTQELS